MSEIFCQVWVNFASHPKFAKCSLAAKGLWLESLAYCRLYQTDGVFPRGVCGKGDDQREAAEAQLLSTGLWVERGDDLEVANYAGWNQTKAQIQTAITKRKTIRERFANKPRMVPPISISLSSSLNRSSDPDPDLDLKPPSREIEIANDNSRAMVLVEEEQEKPEPTRPELYRQAYEAGISKASGGRYGMPRAQEGELHQAIQAFARSKSTGKALRGDKLLSWIGHAAEDFFEGVAAKVAKDPKQAQFYSACGPRGFLRWLNEEELALETRKHGS